ncbi:MAG TPA: phage tail tape measure protein, partial [Nitrososphaera sp.]
MAIGAHELLLIVRGQNQASAMLGRVGRDIRRLQAQRDLSVMRAQQMNRLSGLQIRQAQQLARIESTFEEQGKVRLQYQIQAQRNALHQLNIQNRIANLEIRRTAIERAGANLAVQRLRLLQQQASVESNLEKIELRRQGINNQIGRIGTSVLRNGVQQAELRRRQYSLETQFMERQLALSKATAAVTAARRDPKTGRYAAVPEELVTQEEIRRRRVHETELALAEIPGRSRVLESSLQDLRANVTRLQYSLQGLKAEEVRAAESAGILAKRIQALSAQEANLVARTAAVSGANAELNLQLEITQKELEKLTAAWRAEIASGQAAVAQWELATKQIAMMNAEIAQTDAAMARIGPERMATIARGISHLGRVMQTAGLIGVAALGAMAVSAAHFNTEAIRVSTQTGNVFTSTGQTVVANSEKISKAVTDAMQTIPANQHDLTDALYTIYSTTDATLGQGAKLVKLFGDAWVAGGMIGNVNDVSQALVTLANNWDINTGNMAEFRKLAASTLATVRFGGLTLEQYTQTMNQLAPAFKTAHQSIEQMNGAIAFMTRLLPSQRMSAAGLARLMDIIGRFAAHPASGFEKLAKSIVDVNGNLIPLDQIINKFIQTSRAMGTDITKNGVALNQWLKTISNQEGTVQARRALQALVQQYGLYTNILRKTSGDRKEFTRDLQAMRQSTGYKWDVFVNQMRALGLELGAVVVPALMKLVAPLQHLAKWFNGLSDAQKKSYGEWATWIAAATLAIGVIASVAGALAATIISLKMIRNSFTVLGGEAGFLSVRLGLVLGALALLIPILHSFGINLSDILNVLTGSGGLIGAIKLLGVVITALTFGKLIKALATTALGMDAATRATNRFGKALLLLSTMSLGEAIIAGVGGYSLAKFIDNLDTAALPGKGMGEAFR